MIREGVTVTWVEQDGKRYTRTIVSPEALSARIQAASKNDDERGSKKSEIVRRYMASNAPIATMMIGRYQGDTFEIDVSAGHKHITIVTIE